MNTGRNAVQIHPDDDVAVALRPLLKGATVLGVLLREDIPSGHKFALRDISIGCGVRKYGQCIGTAIADISIGSWVHVHNVKTALSESGQYNFSSLAIPFEMQAPPYFMGYLRADQRVGIRNELWIIPTVGCVNDVCKLLEASSRPLCEALGLDGVFHFPHPYGCSQLGEDHADTRAILAALCRHPNAGGVLVVSLGCENNRMTEFREAIGPGYENKLRFMVCQEVNNELETGLALLTRLAQNAAKEKRSLLPASKLVVGMKCGGSDGLSGITANPCVGNFSDLFVAMGGTTILTEVPEMFGAEALLFQRCRDQETFRKAVGMIERFKRYFVEHGQTVYENPSPGNKDGGITTLEDKSLGCVQKGGNAPIADVLDYGNPVVQSGLNLLYGPGNDLVSATALTAAGAQLILFTTGRGTPFGAPVPTIKIASNSELAARKPHWIDFDAGSIAAGESISDAATRLLRLVLETAAGKNTCNEEQGQRGIAIWKNGITL